MGLFGKKNENYISSKETKRISKENRRITGEIEKKRNRKNIPESEYITTMKNPDNVVEFDNVHTYFFTDIGTVKAVDGVSFEVPQGKTVGIVGESGCGKSVTSLSLMQLVQRPQGQTVEGEIRFNSGDKVYNIVNTPITEMQKLRGNAMSMIFQEPMTSLNPVLTCGYQISEAILQHKDLSRSSAREKAIRMLKKVGIQSPETRYNCYPHELSGGMRQRVMIAMALCCSPELLIADEPTTALDPTIQAQILELIGDLQRETGMTVVYITHDLGVVAETCRRAIVMYAGRVMETAGVRDLFRSPAHPYTAGLMKAMPKLNEKCGRLYSIEGNVPNFADMPAGCAFHDRCPVRMDICARERPGVCTVGPEHTVCCWRAQKNAAGGAREV